VIDRACSILAFRCSAAPRFRGPAVPRYRRSSVPRSPISCGGLALTPRSGFTIVTESTDGTKTALSGPSDRPRRGELFGPTAGNALMYQSIATLVSRRSWIVFLIWVGIAGALLKFAPTWDAVSRDDDVRFFPAGYPSVVGQNLLERGFPDDSASSEAVVIAERRNAKLTDRDFAYVVSLSKTLNRLRKTNPDLGLKKVVDYRAPLVGPRLIGDAKEGDGQAVLTLVKLSGTYLSKQSRHAVDRLSQTLASLDPPPAGLRLEMTGSAPVGHDMNAASDQSAANTTTATILLVIAILLFVYRSPLLALIPLVTIALSVIVSLDSIALLASFPKLNIQVINITNVFVIVILFGAGTDYCLFLIARYREELTRGKRWDDALAEAINKVGGALIASAGTVICGLGMLWFSSFSKIRYTGPTIAVSLAISLAASLTLAPVLLHWLRGRVFWPFRPPHHERGRDIEEEIAEDTPLGGFWTKVADFVVAYPGRILLVSLIVLAPFAVIGLRTKASYSQLADLSSDQPSVRGEAVVRRYFPTGELGPTTALIAHPSISFRTSKGRKAIETLSAELAAIPNVAEVRSVTRPLGQPLSSPTPLGPRRPGPAGAGFFDRWVGGGLRTIMESPIAVEGVRTLAEGRYVSVSPAVAEADRERVTRIDVVFKIDPFSPESLKTLQNIERIVGKTVSRGGALEGGTAGYTGSTVQIDDLRVVTTRDEHRMYLLVTLGVYAILLTIFRRPGISLYLIATVVFGYLASLGITELVFRALSTSGEPWMGLDWKVGFFLFVILVAVGEDYNIFLMSRVLEEERRYGPVEGTRRAVAHTGGIISSCGLIMAGTFGSMITASLVALRELGFALCLGVLLDTFIVRPILVPAFVVLLYRRRDGEARKAKIAAQIDRDSAVEAIDSKHRRDGELVATDERSRV
jgi:RND superfamily putative drug exporter